MELVRDLTEINAKLKVLKAKSKIAFVPTMGALHAGHLALVKEAKKLADIVVVSIFVNPKQFERIVDFNSYPNQLATDTKLLAELNVDFILVPDAADFYPANFKTKINLAYFNEMLCGKTRPGHLDGVALVLTKFFNILNPDFVLLGLKDYQQYFLVKTLVQDLNFSIEVVGVPTIREESGLAKSSRNLNLSKEQLEIAPQLYKSLSKIKNDFTDLANLTQLLATAQENLLCLGFTKIDYLEVLAADLGKVTHDNYQTARIFVAAYLGEVRLIDNLELC